AWLAALGWAVGAVGLKARRGGGVELCPAVEAVAVARPSAGLGNQPGEVPLSLGLQRDHHRRGPWSMAGAAFEHHLDALRLQSPDPEVHPSLGSYLCSPGEQPLFAHGARAR